MLASLRVGLDLSSEPPRTTGVGAYALGLAGALGALDEPDLEVVAFASPALGVQGVPVVPTPFGGGSSGLRRAFQQAVMPAYALGKRVDVLHSVNNLAPLLFPGRTVLSFQDAKLYRAAKGGPLLRRIYRRALHRRSARSADLVLVASEWSKREAVSTLGVDPVRVKVIPYGIDWERFDSQRADPAADARVLDRHDLRGRKFVLVVATREPAKNLARSLEAFAGVARSHPDLLLVLCGGRGWGEGDLEEQATCLGIRSRLWPLGYVPSGDVPALYRASRAFLFPSLIEGFGFPILEAFAAGTPVITSTASACPETAGGAAMLVDPTDTDEIGRALGEILADGWLSADLIALGRARAATCTWERCARATLAAYRELLVPKSPTIHLASYLEPRTFYSGAGGGESRDRALIEHLALRGRPRVHYMARGIRYPLALAELLGALIRERDAVFYLQYPRMPTTLRGSFPHGLVRTAFLFALRRAARRNRVLIDISDLPVEQAADLGEGFGATVASQEGFHSFERLLAELPIDLVFASRAMADFARDRYGFDERRIQIAINGAPPAPLALTASQLRELRGDAPQDALWLAYAGGLFPGRGVEQMVETLQRVSRPIRVLLMGPGGDWLNALDDPRIRHVGPLQERRCQQVTQTCDLALIPYDPVAQPYWTIAYPIKLSFYLALGLPILSTRVVEAERVLAETGSGRCLPLGEWVEFLDAHDAKAQTELVRAAREAASEFTWTRVLAGVTLTP